jgi:hypothetical protein
MTFIGITFGIAALVLFILAISQVFKGKVGTAIWVGLAAFILSGIAGAAIALG